jgi:hypothetical protein
MTRTTLILAALAVLLPAATQAVELPQNDYPTVARADYVFAWKLRTAQVEAELSSF